MGHRRFVVRLGPWDYPDKILEHRAGIEPAYTGFADLRVSHFATGAHCRELGTGAALPASSRAFSSYVAAPDSTHRKLESPPR